MDIHLSADIAKATCAFNDLERGDRVGMAPKVFTEMSEACKPPVPPRSQATTQNNSKKAYLCPNIGSTRESAAH